MFEMLPAQDRRLGPLSLARSFASFSDVPGNGVRTVESFRGLTDKKQSARSQATPGRPKRFSGAPNWDYSAIHGQYNSFSAESQVLLAAPERFCYGTAEL